MVFLHGFNESIEIWEPLIDKLTDSFTCVCIDLPGFGKSTLPSQLTIPFIGDACMDVIRFLNLERPVLIGHSMGGYIVLDMIRKHENEFSGASLFHSTADPDSEEKIENRKKTIEFLNHNPKEGFLKIFIEGLFAPFNRGKQKYKFIENPIYGTSQVSVINATKAMMERESSIDVLEKSEIPWLFIAGKYDQHLKIEQLSLQASFCKKSQFYILNNSGHLGMIEEPENSAILLKKFMKWIFEIKKT